MTTEYFISIESSGYARMATAAIEQEGRYLITQRRSAGVFPGLWEFPSARVEPGETDEVALKREIRGLLGVEVKVGRLRAYRIQNCFGYDVNLALHEASIVPAQTLRPVCVADVRWVTAEELRDYVFAPADQATAELLIGFGESKTQAVVITGVSKSEASIESRVA
jgi:8-oxo-dGTP diphosphatase